MTRQEITTQIWFNTCLLMVLVGARFVINNGWIQESLDLLHEQQWYRGIWTFLARATIWILIAFTILQVVFGFIELRRCARLEILEVGRIERPIMRSYFVYTDDEKVWLVPEMPEKGLLTTKELPYGARALQVIEAKNFQEALLEFQSVYETDELQEKPKSLEEL